MTPPFIRLTKSESIRKALDHSGKINQHQLDLRIEEVQRKLDILLKLRELVHLQYEDDVTLDEEGEF